MAAKSFAHRRKEFLGEGMLQAWRETREDSSRKHFNGNPVFQGRRDRPPAPPESSTKPAQPLNQCEQQSDSAKNSTWL
jgi:hypothetical protein